MTLSNPILALLYTLKLGGMAEAYQEQCATAEFAELGFEDRLGMLLEREHQHRGDRSYRARLRQAQLRERADIADVTCTAGRGITRTVLLNLAAGSWIHAGANLSIIGATGTGKTFLACALANQACRQNRSVAYVRVPELVLALGATRGGERYRRLMRRMIGVDLLVLDDWGLQSFSADARRDILEIHQAQEQPALQHDRLAAPGDGLAQRDRRRLHRRRDRRPPRALRPPDHPLGPVLAHAHHPAADRHPGRPANDERCGTDPGQIDRGQPGLTGPSRTAGCP